MLVGLIGSGREDVLRSPERLQELATKMSEALKQLPKGVSVKARYVFSSGDTAKSIIIFDAQSPEQLMPLQLAVMEHMQCEFCPVIDNTEEVVQQALR